MKSRGRCAIPTSSFYGYKKLSCRLFHFTFLLLSSLIPKLFHFCYYCCWGKMRSETSMENFCSHRAEKFDDLRGLCERRPLTSSVHCQQPFMSMQWEKLMALLRFPVSLPHFLFSFACLSSPILLQKHKAQRCTLALLNLM